MCCVEFINYPNGTTETYTYDEVVTKRVKTHTDANGVKTTYLYDSNGNLTGTVVTPASETGGTKLIGGTTTYTGAYETGSVDPFGNTVEQVVNTTKGLVTSVTDAKNNTKYYYYDPNTDALTSLQDGTFPVQYLYTKERLTSIGRSVSGSGIDSVYAFTYDPFGNTDTILVGNQSVRRLLVDYDYEQYNGKLLKTTYGNGFYTEPVYDVLDRVIGMKYNGVKRFTWDFNYKGQLAQHVDMENSKWYRYEYDTAGRLLRSVGRTSEMGQPIEIFTNTYNNKGQVTGLSYTIDGVTHSNMYVYETNGRLWRESHGNDTLVYSYDKWGRLSYQNLMGMSANILMRTLVFDAGLDTEDGDKTTTTRIKQETLASSAGFSQTWGYTYDANGNIVGITRNGNPYGTYAYDRWNQLTAATHNGIVYNYTYDAGGNIKSKTVNGVTTTYTYGDSLWKDLLTGYGSETFTYDTIGNPLTWRGGATMTWEGRRLTGYARQGSGLSMSFAYNADGIRTKKVVNGSTYEYTLDGSKIVRQKNGSNIIYFAYDASGNLYSMTTGGTTYYYVRNMQGDILGLNDTSGNQVASYAYDPWGNITNISGSNTTIANLNPFRYRGYYYDFETGLYYLQSRYYDPVVGRFISPDTVDILTASPTSMTDKNLFAYCDNNPIIREDNGGYFWDTVFDVISLGASIVEVCINPTDPWAWAGLAGDAVDLIPFVTGVGEVTRIAKTADTVMDVADDIHDVAKIADDLGDTSKRLHRPYIRKSTRESVEKAALRSPDGHFLDANTGKVIYGKYDLGHSYGHEFWRERQMAESLGWTQKQFNDYMNNPLFYRIEDPHLNRSHRYEMR